MARSGEGLGGSEDFSKGNSSRRTRESSGGHVVLLLRLQTTIIGHAWCKQLKKKVKMDLVFAVLVCLTFVARAQIESFHKVSNLSGTFTAELASNNYFGYSMTGLGDFNLDEIDDLAGMSCCVCRCCSSSFSFLVGFSWHKEIICTTKISSHNAFVL